MKPVHKSVIIVLCIILALVGIICYFCFKEGSSVDFDIKYLGVLFTVDVKKRDENFEVISDGGEESYSLENVKTMLEVISGKFTRIATVYVGAHPVPYTLNSTYYGNFGQAFVAEAAALINKERNETALKILVGIWQSPDPQQVKSEIALALESVAKAIEIYPGTVEGLIFSGVDSLEGSNQTLNNIRFVKDVANRVGLKIGVRQMCSIAIKADDSTTDEQALTCKNIVKEADFIFAQFYERDYDYTTVEVAEIAVEDNLLDVRDRLKKINSNIEMMVETGWPSQGLRSWENIGNMEKYWKSMNKLARKHKITIWMNEAIDNPWKKERSLREAHWGWWRLKNNFQINEKEGYKEKITE